MTSRKLICAKKRVPVTSKRIQSPLYVVRACDIRGSMRSVQVQPTSLASCQLADASSVTGEIAP
jgi:hypothetical protein